MITSIIIVVDVVLCCNLLLTKEPKKHSPKALCMYVTSKIITTECFLFVSFNTLSRNKNFGSRHLTSNSLFLRFTVGFFFSNSTPLKVFVKYSYYYWNRIIQENLEKKKILSNSNFKCTCASDVILQLCGFITIFEECKLLLWFFPFW